MRFYGLLLFTWLFAPYLTPLITLQYFSTWSGFIVAIFLLVECYHGFMEERGEGSSAIIAESAKVTVTDRKDGPGVENDIEVEVMPDDQNN